jgi:hypothetical protein
MRDDLLQSCQDRGSLSRGIFHWYLWFVALSAASEALLLAIPNQVNTKNTFKYTFSSLVIAYWIGFALS